MKKIKVVAYVLSVLVALAALVLIFVFVRNNVETQTMNEEARKSAAGKFIQLLMGLLITEMGGPDTAKTIILVHGLLGVPYYLGMEHSTAWCKQVFT